MQFENYYLNIKAVNSLPENDKETIHNYYRDMLFSFHDNRLEMAKSYYHTLSKSGYLLSIRDENIETILS